MPEAPRPHRYVAIADEIRRAIRQDAYAPDGRLPSERRLVRAYGAQRNTIRQALAVLEEEGRIASVDKSGWFVSSVENPAEPRSPAGKRVLFVTFRRIDTPQTDCIAQALRDTLAEEGVSLLRYDTARQEEASLAAAVDEVIRLRPDGVAMWPLGSLEMSFLAKLAAATALVLIDRRAFGFHSDSVRFNDAEGGRLVTEHLLERGHRRIAFLGDEPFVESVQSRWTGYRKALEEAGLGHDDNLTQLRYGSREPGFSASLRFLLRELPDPPSAVVCSNDDVASRMMMFCREAGLRVPEDVAITGFGNAASGYLDVMGLTTVAQPFAELGRAAGELLLRRLGEPYPAEGERRESRLPMTLVVRESSGAHAPRSG